MQNLPKIIILSLALTLSVSCKSLEYLESDLDLSSPQVGQKVVLKCGSILWTIGNVEHMYSKAYPGLDKELRPLLMLMKTSEHMTIKVTYFKYESKIASITDAGSFSHIISDYFVNNGISSERVEYTWDTETLNVGKYHRLSGRKRCRYNRGEVVITAL